MESAEKLSVTITSAMAKMIRDKVEDGSYGSASEVVRAGLRALQRDEEEHAERLASIRKRIASSIDDTRPGYSPDEMQEHFRRLYDKATGKRHDSAA